MKFSKLVLPLRHIVNSNNYNYKPKVVIKNGSTKEKLTINITLGSESFVITMPSIAGPSLILCESDVDGVGVTTQLHSAIESLIMIEAGLIKQAYQRSQVQKAVAQALDNEVISLVQTSKVYASYSDGLASTDFNCLKALAESGTFTTVDLSSHLALWVPSGLSAESSLTEAQKASIEDAKETMKISDRTEFRCPSAAFTLCASNSLFFYKVLLKIATFGIVPENISVDSVLSLIDSTISMHKLNPALSRELNFGEPELVPNFMIPDSLDEMISAAFGITIDSATLAVYDKVVTVTYPGGQAKPTDNPLATMLSGDLAVDAEGTVTIGGVKTDIKGAFRPSSSLVTAEEGKKIFSLLLAILSYHKTTRYSSESNEIINYCNNPRLVGLLSRKVVMDG